MNTSLITPDLIGAGIASVTFVSVLLIAAAKSIFQTKEDAEMTVKDINAKLYDDNSITIFVPRIDCNKHKEDEERRTDKAQRATCNKIDKLEQTVLTGYEKISKAQGKTNEHVSNLTGRVDQFLKEDSKIDDLTKTVDGLVLALGKTDG